MLDSLLTMTKGGAFWMAVGLLTCLVADRAVSMLSGSPITLFGMLGVLLAFAFVVRAVYTLAKMGWHRLHPST